jgi:hypothetical protein
VAVKLVDENDGVVEREGPNCSFCVIFCGERQFLHKFPGDLPLQVLSQCVHYLYKIAQFQLTLHENKGKHMNVYPPEKFVSTI